jgi:hypothetical protein
MSDNKKKKDGRDDSKVDSKDGNEVNYVHHQFPSLSVAQVKAAINAAGPSRKKICAWIRKKHGL